MKTDNTVFDELLDEQMWRLDYDAKMSENHRLASEYYKRLGEHKQDNSPNKGPVLR